jgi:DNA ligase 1
MLLDEIVRTVGAVAGTRSRLAKVDLLATLLGRLDAHEVVAAVGMLVAAPRQGRLGIGWRTLVGLADDVSHVDAPSLEVGDVDAAFTELASASGAGATSARAATLTRLAERATAEEWDLLQRVMIGELRTGALEGVLLDAIARAADAPVAVVRRAAMLSGDLRETARLALAEGTEALAAVGLVVGRPVLPMLASTAPSVPEALTTAGPAAVEFKLDGARIQVHKHGDDVAVFTRTLADVTHRVPELVEIVRTLPAHDVILDGETLALDEEGDPRPFQDTMARFGADRASAVALRPWFFDILHLDGRDLLDEPLRVRREALAAVAGDWTMPGTVTDDPQVAAAVSTAALAAGHEGVVVKGLEAPYAAGRRGASWIKVKPVLTYDLVVLGVEWGSGRREGWLSNLHLGARDPDGEFGDPGGFVMVGKTFKGLTDEILRWQTEHFLELETGRTRGAVSVVPSTVVEIAIDGVQRSSRYPGGVALRFARVKGYRPDKVAAEADTIGALRELLRPTAP